MTAPTREARIARDDLATIRAALNLLPTACHYHGTGLDRPGPFGPACCGTGSSALARREALAALDRLDVLAGEVVVAVEVAP